jgi:hypothetical protein
MNRRLRGRSPGFSAFPEIVDGHDEDRLFANADRIATHIDVEAPVLDFLWGHSRWQFLPRSQWENEIRRSLAIDQVLSTYFRSMRFGRADFRRFIDPAAVQKLKETVVSDPSGRGTLLLTFHGTFPTIARMLFSQLFPDGVQLAARTVGGDPRSAMFNALRALQEGRPVLLSPDGAKGKLSAKLSFLGKTRAAGSGAAYLAHASRCRTAWYVVCRDGERFFPVVDAGPSPAEGESFNAFASRLFDFCSARIETILTGDPQNLMLREPWRRSLLKNDS